MSKKKNNKPVSLNQYVSSTAQRIKSQGHDLVKISTHKTDCHFCKPWQGKILSITGKTPGYHTLEEAQASGLFHEGCRHAMGLYIDLDKEIEELEKELKTPRKQIKQPKGCGCSTVIAVLSIILILIIICIRF